MGKEILGGERKLLRGLETGKRRSRVFPLSGWGQGRRRWWTDARKKKRLEKSWSRGKNSR